LLLLFLPQIVEDDDGQGVMRIELQREKKGNSQKYFKLEFWGANGLHSFMLICSFQGEGWVLTSGEVKTARMYLGIQVSSSPGSTEKARQLGTGD